MSSRIVAMASCLLSVVIGCSNSDGRGEPAPPPSASATKAQPDVPSGNESDRRTSATKPPMPVPNTGPVGTPPVIPSRPEGLFQLSLDGVEKQIDLEDEGGWKPAAGHHMCAGDCGATPPIVVTAWVIGPNRHEDGFFKEEAIHLRLR